MPRVSQDTGDIKHLVLLRKALAGRHSLEIYSRDPSMRLTIGEGMFYGGDAIETVCTMIEKPVQVFDWEQLERRVMFIAQNPKDIFSHAITRMRPHPERITAYLNSFSKLPRVQMRMNSTFHFDRQMQYEYQVLYRLSLDKNGASLADYLSSAAGLEQLTRRTGVVIAGFCLGDLVSAVNVDRRSGKKGVVARIMARLRHGGRS